jgi:8-oxo-dGTP diphosphatase
MPIAAGAYLVGLWIAVKPYGETIHQALIRECQEELSCPIQIDYLSGVYFHAALQSHAFIFRAQLIGAQLISLSDEHSAFAWFAMHQLSPVQRLRVEDCLNFNGQVHSRCF